MKIKHTVMVVVELSQEDLGEILEEYNNIPADLFGDLELECPQSHHLLDLLASKAAFLSEEN